MSRAPHSVRNLPGVNIDVGHGKAWEAPPKADHWLDQLYGELYDFSGHIIGKPTTREVLENLTHRLHFVVSPYNDAHHLEIGLVVDYDNGSDTVVVRPTNKWGEIILHGYQQYLALMEE